MINNADVYGIVTAAGSGARMGTSGDKLFKIHLGKPLIYWSVKVLFDANPAGVIVTFPAGRRVDFAESLKGMGVQLIEGGSSRQDSVFRALAAVPAESCDYVLIHDGARPFASIDLVKRVVDGMRQCGACVPGVPSADTVYRINGEWAEAVLPRESLFSAQTPQGFSLPLVLDSHRRYLASGGEATDEGGMLMSCGYPVRVVTGEKANVKITVPEDLRLLSALLPTRVGYGYDVHRLVAGRNLVLGGVAIPCDKGLMGHSDADVVVHAIMDALLGAFGLGDIGMLFPDTDPAYKDADSLTLLAEVRRKIVELGGVITHIDVTLLLEAPKVTPYKDLMRENIARVLQVASTSVNIKATTNEGMGHIGRGEGAACHATATVAVR